MKRFLFLLVLILNTTFLWSQARLKRDSAFIAARSFNNSELKYLKEQKEFQYNRSKAPVPSLWERFWNWFWWKVGQVLKTKSGKITFWSILIMLAIAVMVYFISKITGMDQNGLFGRGNKGLQKYTLSQDDIHNISFEEAIENAISSENYRLATRLQYLQALKKLSDKGYIDWRINKTNTDYLAEIAGKPFYNSFNRLTANFEYTWYGEQLVSKGSFLEMRSQFQQFNTQVH